MRWISFIIMSLVVTGIDGEEAECGKAADVIFVIDSSRSIWERNFKTQLSAVQKICDIFQIAEDKVRVGVITFGEYVNTEFSLDNFTNGADVKSHVGSITHLQGWQTNTHLALKQMIDMFIEKGRDGVPKIGIVLTDGAATVHDKTIAMADAAKEGKYNIRCTIFAIGVGNKVKETELKEIASYPPNIYSRKLATYEELDSRDFTRLLALKACKVTTPTPITTTTELPIKDAEEECQGKKADVVFVIDRSSSIWIEDFKTQLQFLKHVVDIFDMGGDKTQVGMVSFNDSATIEFYLNEHQSKENVENAIVGVAYFGGVTNTAEAIQMMNDNVFNTDHGLRPDVAHIGIVITDGISMNPTDTAAEAARAKSRGIDMFAIGIGKNIGVQELNAIASSPSDEFVYTLNGYKALEKIKTILAYKTCEAKEKSDFLADTSERGIIGRLLQLYKKWFEDKNLPVKRT